MSGHEEARTVATQAGSSGLNDFLSARFAEEWEVARAEVERVRGAARRNGKARALRMAREVEAKRRVVEEAALWGCQRTMSKILALPYADHPDYREEWRP